MCGEGLREEGREREGRRRENMNKHKEGHLTQ